MDFDQYLACIDVESNRLASATRDLDAAVPPCPGWTVAEAVRHTGSVYWHKIMCMRLQRFPEDAEWQQGPSSGEDLVEWFRDAYRIIRQELVTRGPASPSPTWWPADQTVGFWYRRMAQEVAIHRADVESASGPITAIDAEIAIDGVDEVLRRFLFNPYDDRPTVTAAHAVRVSTGGRQWVVRIGPDDAGVYDDGDATASVEGAPSDVDLWLWARVPDNRVTLAGSPESLTVFRDWLTVATQ